MSGSGAGRSRECGLFSIRVAAIANARTVDPDGRFAEGDGCLVRNVQPSMSEYLRRFPAFRPSRSDRYAPDSSLSGDTVYRDIRVSYPRPFGGTF